MAICSHCGRQSQENALVCQFCGYPLADQADDIAAQETIYSASPDDNYQHNGASSGMDTGQENGRDTVAAAPRDGTLAEVVVRPLQSGNEPARSYALTGQTVSIGRSPSCEIVLDHDQLTSRRHALLRYDGASYSVVDLGSSNGTFVNNAEIRDATPLNNGDRIIVGEHELTFSTEVSGAAKPAGVDMASGPPSSPLVDTGARPAVTPNQQPAPVAAASAESADSADSDEAETNYMATVMAGPMEAAVAPSAVADTSHVAGNEDVADVSDVADVADVADMSTVTGMAAVPESSPAGDIADMPTNAVPASGVTEQPAAAPTAAPTAENQQALLARAPSSGALRQPGGELDQLRDQLRQLAATSEAVAQHAAEETDLSEQRRQALAETRDQLHAILAGIQNAPSPTNEADSDDTGDTGDTGDLNDLISLTKQTADDPNHLQNVSRMAEHAGEIARALESLQARRIQPPPPSPTENALEELRALQARLDELA